MTTTSTDYSAYTTGTSSTSTTSSATASSATTAYNTFLSLLTTQLQHQDPLNPTETDTFTSQLIQLSSVEQQLKINETLTSMSSDLTAITAANGLGYIGKTITASGSTVPLQDGSADWNYTLGSTAYSVKLSVVNSDGTTVYSTTGDTASGSHSFSWDGKTTSGTAAPAGDYTLKVEAYDTAGKAVTTSTEISGVVTGVDNSSGSTVLKIGDIEVALSKVTSLTN